MISSALSGGEQGCARACAGAKEVNFQSGCLGLLRQSKGGNETPGEQRNVEAQAPRVTLGDLLFRTQQVDEQRSQPGLLKVLATARLRGLCRKEPLP
jgi:hypothetical protein